MAKQSVFGNHSFPCGKISLDKLLTSCEGCVLSAEHQVIKLKMNFEKHRLESFVNWPLSWLKPKDLAKKGFYYTGLGDMVKCNYCGVKLQSWHATDTIEEEHRTFSPNCHLVQGIRVTNYPLPTKPAEKKMIIVQTL